VTARALPGVCALAVLAGVGALLGTRDSNTAGVSPQDQPRVLAPAPQKNIAFPKAAWRVAREFVFTAVARKHLAESYAISHPDVKSALTLKQWKTGKIPVPFIPVAEIKKWNWKNTNYVHPRDVQQNVILIPTKASKQRPYYAVLGVTKVGWDSDARWLVSYFALITGGCPCPAP